MDLRDAQSLVTDWMESGYFVGVGLLGAILVVLGLRRDDVVGWIFLAAGVALVAIGFGAQFLGWNPLGL
jgi:hypothetical protein